MFFVLIVPYSLVFVAKIISSFCFYIFPKFCQLISDFFLFLTFVVLSSLKLFP